VLKEGVNMTEITAKLLEKIEEQTLYIIDLQKQINELKKLIEKK
jgi:prephenate dehydratase